LKKRLDNFLLFFQMYTFTKSQPLPMDVDFMLTDTYELLRRKNDAYKSFSEAAVAVDEMSAREGANDHVEEDEAEDGFNDVRRGTLDNVDGAEDDGAEEEDVGDKDGDDTDESSTAQEGSDSSNSDQDKDEDEDEINAERRSKDPNAMTEDQEDEFNRELAKMMANVGEAGRKAPERKQLDVAVPLVRKAGATSSGVVEDDMEDVAHESDKGMRFTMLTKKGNKQQVS
jgi:regulator of nonsense transcripts 2